MRVQGTQGSPAHGAGCASTHPLLHVATPVVVTVAPGTALPMAAGDHCPPMPHRHVVIGGGAPARAMPGGAQPVVLIDPELVALGLLLDAAALPERPASKLQVVTNLLAQLGRTIGELAERMTSRLAITAPAGEPAVVLPLPQAPPAPMQPPPPPPSFLLTLMPDGSIQTPPGGEIDGAPDVPRGAGGTVDGSTAPPSSWLPIPGMPRFDRVRMRGRDLIQRFDDLCDDLGITRLALVALSILAPLAAALVIQAVAAVLG